MKSIDRGFKKNILVIAAGLLFAVAAFAFDLSQAKQQGLVGETGSGYLGVVVASSEATALVNDINAKRRAYYQGIATKNGIAIKDVELLAGKKAIEKTASGQYVKVRGQWKKK